MISCGMSVDSREYRSSASEPVDSIATDSSPPMLRCMAEGVSVISYHVFGTLLVDSVPTTVADIATVLL